MDRLYPVSGLGLVMELELESSYEVVAKVAVDPAAS